MVIREAEAFSVWLRNLRDHQAKAKIGRVRRRGFRNAGDVKLVGEGVSELRIHQECRLSRFTLSKGCPVLIVLLCGED